MVSMHRMLIVEDEENLKGPGIPENKLDTIFNRYYRVKSARESVPEGLGLGLTISKHMEANFMLAIILGRVRNSCLNCLIQLSQRKGVAFEFG